MGKMKTKNNYLKYVVIALVVVFLVTGALMLLEIWEKNHGQFQDTNTENGAVVYQGEEYVLKDGIETFLVLGLDKFQGASSSDSHESGTVQADFLMLFVFNNATKEAAAIHVNRDTMANVNKLDITGKVIGTEKKQIALAYNFDYKSEGDINCRNTADSVSDLLLGVKIDHYLSLTMDSVKEINDLVGGVTLTVLDDFTGIDDTLIQGEEITLTGEQALRYIRTRYGMEDSTNNTRMVRQQQYVDALLDKTLGCIETDGEFLLKAVDKVMPYMEHNSTHSGLKEFADKFDEYEFLGIKELEGETKLGEEFMEFYPNEDSIWKTVIDQFYRKKTDTEK